MNKFIVLVQSFIDQKINFKEFDKEWTQLYHFSGIYEDLSDSETNFLDEINDREDYTLEDKKELKEVEKYNFVSTEEFRSWLKEYLIKNEKIISKYLN